MKIQNRPIAKYLFIFTLHIILLISPVYSDDNSSKVDELLNTGIDNLIAGNQLKGIQCFNDALKIESDNYFAYLNRGKAYLSLFDYKKALPDFLKCIELEPENPDSYFELGYLEGNQGHFEKAIQYYSKSIETDPNYLQAYGTRAIMKAFLGRVDNAITDLTYAISVNPDDPNFPMLYIVRAQAWELKCNCKNAIEDFEKGMSFDQKEYNSNSNIAWILVTCPDKKYRNIKKAEKLVMMDKDPETGEIDFKVMAAIKASKGDFKKAIAYQKKAINKLKENQPLCKMEEIHQGKTHKKLLDQLQSYESQKPWQLQ